MKATLFSLVTPFGAVLPTVSANSMEWSITNLTSHFMGANSGLPGGSWPSGETFNSTIDFVFRRTTVLTNDSGAAASDASCSANWTEPDYPKKWQACSGSDPFGFDLKWRFRAAENFTAANFTLEFLIPTIARYVSSSPTKG
jgi:hypothetical protein